MFLDFGYLYMIVYGRSVCNNITLLFHLPPYVTIPINSIDIPKLLYLWINYNW